MSSSYNLPKILVALLEHTVKPFIGEETIAELKKPVLEAELQAELRAASERAETRWLARYADADLRALIQGDTLAGLEAVQTGLRQMAETPASPILETTLDQQLLALLPPGYPRERAQRALVDYLEILRQELVGIEAFRDKLTALSQLALERSTREIAAHSGRTAANTEALVDRLGQLIELTSRQGRPGEPTDAALAGLEAKFRKVVAAEFEYLDFKGQIDTTEPLRLPLEEVYVQLRAVANVPERDEFTPRERELLRELEAAEHAPDPNSKEPRPKASKERIREIQLQLEASRRDRWTQERMERFPIADALANVARRGLVILGDPGSGKTTLLNFLARVFALGPQAVRKYLQLDGADTERLPIFAPFAYYDVCLDESPRLSVEAFLSQYYADQKALPGLAPLFAQAIQSGRALILLDGLDEVVHEDRRQYVATQASAFVRNAIAQGNRVLLTTRIFGYSTARLSTDLQHVTVLDFRREDIEIFARQLNQALVEWEFKTLAPEQRAQRARDEERRLLAEIHSNPAVERLAANPLMLSMLALLRRKVGRLPAKRIRLYAQYLEALIERWETVRSRVRTDLPVRLDTSETAYALIPLAFWLQQNKPSGTASESEILTQIASHYLERDGLDPRRPARIAPAVRLAAEQRARHFLDDMRHFAGLLVERGHNAFDFRHLTFREYYVARALARMTPLQRWRVLKENLHANRWREPILLAAAQLGTEQSDSQSATALVKKILNARSPYEEILHRDLFLAADCAADDVNLDVVVLRDIVRRLDQVAVSGLPILIQSAISRLVALSFLRTSNGPRLPEAEAALRRLVTETPGGVAEHDVVNWCLPFVAESTFLRQALLARIESPDTEARSAVVRALTPFVAEDAAIREGFLALLQDSDETVRQLAATAMMPLVRDDAALRDAMLARLDPETNHWTDRRAAVEALAPLVQSVSLVRESVRARLTDEDSDVRAAAVNACAACAVADGALRQELMARLQDEVSDVRWAVIRALTPRVADEPELLEQVREQRTGPGWRTRHAVISILGPMAQTRADIAEDVLGSLDDTDNDVRAAAIDALAPLAERDARWIDPLLERLKDTYANVRAAAIRALAPLAPANERVQTALEERLDDQEQDVLLAAVRALIADERTQSRLERYMRSPRWEVRQALIEGLATPSAPRPLSASELREAMTNDTTWSSGARWAAIRALTPLAHQDGTVRAGLRAFVDDPNGETARLAIVALAPDVAVDPALAKSLRDILTDGYWGVRQAVVDALAPLAGTDPELAAQISRRLKDGDLDVRQSALKALEVPMQSQPELRVAMAGLLGDSESTVREIAYRLLGSWLPTDVSLLPALVASFDNADWNVRIQAIPHVRAWLGRSDLALEALQARFDDSDYDVSREAYIAVIESSPPGVERSTVLYRALSDSKWQVRSAILERYAPELIADPEGRDRVTALLEDDDNDVRQGALRALGALSPRPAGLQERLRGLLGDASGNVRAEVLRLWLGDGPLTVDTIETWLGGLLDEDAGVRDVAVEVLRAQVKPEEPWISRLIETLRRSAAAELPEHAIEVITPLLAAAPRLRDEVAPLLDHSGWRARLRAVTALAPFAAEDEDVRRRLVSGLQDQDPDVRQALVEGLLPMVRAGRLTLPWADLLADRNNQFTVWLINTAPDIVFGDAGCRRALLAGLGDGEPNAPLIAALQPRIAVDPVLADDVRVCLASDRPAMRQGALTLLGPMVPDAPDLLEALITALRDPVDDVAMAAVEALTLHCPLGHDVDRVLLERFARVNAVLAGVPTTDGFTSTRRLRNLLVLALMRSLNRPVVREALTSILSSDDRVLGGYSSAGTDPADQPRIELVRAWGEWLQTAGPAALAEMMDALRSEDHLLRQSAAEILGVAGLDVIRQAAQSLRNAADDWRGHDAWPARLAAAEVLLADRQHVAEAVRTILAALDATALPRFVSDARAIRRRAIQALARLKSIDQFPEVPERVRVLLDSETDPQIQEDLFRTLGALASAGQAAEPGTDLPIDD